MAALLGHFEVGVVGGGNVNASIRAKSNQIVIIRKAVIFSEPYVFLALLHALQAGIAHGHKFQIRL